MSILTMFGDDCCGTCFDSSHRSDSARHLVDVGAGVSVGLGVGLGVGEVVVVEVRGPC